MRVFVTGASGWIGSAVIPELRSNGHEVVGLARSDASAEALEAAGARVLRGDLTDLDSLRAGARGSDGVIHLAYVHDFSQFDVNARIDRRAIDTLGQELAGSGRPLVIASGVAALAPGRVATERDTVAPDHPFAARMFNEQAALGFADKDVRSSSVRLAPTVYGDGDHGFLPRVVDAAREKRVSAYVGDGSQSWCTVHRFDAARLFVLALEKAPAGTVLHGIGEQGVPLRDIADVIGRHLEVPVVSIAADDAMEHFGFLGPLLSSDIRASSDLTRALMDWVPVQPGLIEDLEKGHYFRPPTAEPA